MTSQILKTGQIMDKSGKPKKILIAPNGDHRTNYNGKCTSVHILVAKKHLPNPQNLKYVLHLDGNKANNNVTNLTWVNKSDLQNINCRLNKIKSIDPSKLELAKINLSKKPCQHLKPKKQETSNPIILKFKEAKAKLLKIKFLNYQKNQSA